MMKICAVLLLFLCISDFQQSSAKVYTRCGLTQELLRLNFPRSFIGNWVCLIESESSKDTSKVINKATGSKGLGLFQINSKEWCSYGTAGGKCNIKCEDLLNEDVADDAKCAKKIQGQMGFQGWNGWKRSCYRRQLPIPNC